MTKKNAPSRSSQVVSTGMAVAVLAGTTCVLAYQEASQRTSSTSDPVSSLMQPAGLNESYSEELSAWQDDLLQYQAELAQAAENLRVQAEKLRQREGVAAQAKTTRAPNAEESAPPDVPAPSLEAAVVVEQQRTQSQDPSPQWQAPQQPDAASRAS